MRQCSLFGDMNTENIELCPALSQLKEEHTPLNKMKFTMNHLALEYSEVTLPEQYSHSLLRLREEVQSFFDVLKPHSEKEEGALFPMLQKYLGKEAGPLVVMEYEHEEAKKNIESFLKETSHLPEEITKERFQQLLLYIIETYDILTAHFMKEEMILFPMAEGYLTEEEKEELWHKIKA